MLATITDITGDFEFAPPFVVVQAPLTKLTLPHQLDAIGETQSSEILTVSNSMALLLANRARHTRSHSGFPAVGVNNSLFLRLRLFGPGIGRNFDFQRDFTCVGYYVRDEIGKCK